MNSESKKTPNDIPAIKSFSDTTKLLKAKSDVLENILASMGDGLSIQDRDMRIVYQNKFMLDNFGSHTGEYCYKIYEKRDEVCVGCPIIEAYSTGKTCKALRVGVTRDGEKFRFENIATVLRNDKGEIIAGVEVVRLVEERERALEELEKSLGELNSLSTKLLESNSMKDLLLDIITHDLKNPAGAISVAADLLKEDTLDEELIEIIRKGCESMLKIISHSVSLSKVAMDENLATEELNLHTMIEEIIDGFKSSLSNLNMTIDNMIPSTQLIQANPIIEEVFSNYISNAIKYASSGKKIIIDCMEDGEYLNIYVKDFGETIPVDKQKEVFVRNLQLANTKGRGLGLAIVKKIAEAHHGYVWVEPNKPKGNCFAIKIPLRGYKM
ncbi:MAG: ATP-binding protein [Ignavibacteria bacterium]